MANVTTVKVFKRLRACSCGCHGQDPHHQVWYRRQLRDAKDETGECRTTEAVLGVVQYRRTAFVQLPFGRCKVVEADMGHGWWQWWIESASFIAALNGEVC